MVPLPVVLLVAALAIAVGILTITTHRAHLRLTKKYARLLHVHEQMRQESLQLAMETVELIRQRHASEEVEPTASQAWWLLGEPYRANKYKQ